MVVIWGMPIFGKLSNKAMLVDGESLIIYHIADLFDLFKSLTVCLQ